MVTLQDMSLFKIDFPGTPDEGIDYASALNDALPSQPIQIALDRLQANLEVTTRYGNKYYRAAPEQSATRNSPAPRTPPSPARATTSTPHTTATFTGTRARAGSTTIPAPIVGIA
jgi:hypothetical protein